jgi:hypothetical protein
VEPEHRCTIESVLAHSFLSGSTMDEDSLLNIRDTLSVVNLKVPGF